MTMRSGLILLCLLLAGCLTTPRPVFDATNSVPAGESPAFMAFVNAWEARSGDGDSPRQLIGQGARVVELDGQALVQETKQDGTADYYLLGVMGTRPVSCLLKDKGMPELAASFGVTLEVDRDADSDPNLPAQMYADGPDAALDDFIRAAFTRGELNCVAIPVGG